MSDEFNSEYDQNPLCDAFERLHAKRPEIFELFERFTLEAAKVKPRYSAGAIIERIRWWTEVEGHGTFKVNDLVVPFYARMFMQKHPEHRGFFRMRKAAADDHLGYVKSANESDGKNGFYLDEEE